MSKTLGDMMADAGMRKSDLALKSRLSQDTIQRALDGSLPNPVGCWAIAVALGVDEQDVRLAIKASQPEGQS